MSVVPSFEKDEITIRYKNCFYNNLYLEDYKVVIKIPLIKDKPKKNDLKIKKFNLAKYTYLVSYE
ncbi:MAG: hypothetical protein ACTSRT_07820 [Promethearchaeota archaeon]